MRAFVIEAGGFVGSGGETIQFNHLMVFNIIDMLVILVSIGIFFVVSSLKDSNKKSKEYQKTLDVLQTMAIPNWISFMVFYLVYSRCIVLLLPILALYYLYMYKPGLRFGSDTLESWVLRVATWLVIYIVFYNAIIGLIPDTLSLYLSQSIISLFGKTYARGIAQFYVGFFFCILSVYSKISMSVLGIIVSFFVAKVALFVIAVVTSLAIFGFGLFIVSSVFISMLAMPVFTGLLILSPIIPIAIACYYLITRYANKK
jgi:hypothetical protein